MLALPGQSGSFGFGSRHGPSEGALDRLGAPLPRPVGGIDRGNKTALNPAPRRAIQACLPGASGGIALQWTAVNAILGGRPIILVLGGPCAIAECTSRDSGATGLIGGDPDDRHVPGDVG